MIRFLLDTNAISEPIRPRPNAAFVASLGEQAGQCAIAATTWHELLYGLGRLPSGRRRQAIEAYLLAAVQSEFPILPYDAEAAAWHGRERARLEDVGVNTAFADGQIAAVAVTRGLTVVTANGADFRHFQGLRVTSWLRQP